MKTTKNLNTQVGLIDCRFIAKCDIFCASEKETHRCSKKRSSCNESKCNHSSIAESVFSMRTYNLQFQTKRRLLLTIGPSLSLPG